MQQIFHVGVTHLEGVTSLRGLLIFHHHYWQLKFSCRSKVK